MSEKYVVGEPFNPYRQFKGVYIPNAILRCRDIGPTEKLVWGRLAQYAGKNGLVFPKQETLSTELACSRPTVAKALGNLERCGFIRVHRPEGAKRLMHQSCSYEFLWHEVFVSDQDEQPCKTDEPADDKVTDPRVQNILTPPCKDSEHPGAKESNTQLNRIISNKNHTNGVKNKEKEEEAIPSSFLSSQTEVYKDGIDYSLFVMSEEKAKKTGKLTIDEAWSIWSYSKKHTGRYPAVSRTNQEVKAVEQILQNIPSHRLFQSVCERYFGTSDNFYVSNAHSASLLSKRLDLFLREDVNFEDLGSKSTPAVRELLGCRLMPSWA